MRLITLVLSVLWISGCCMLPINLMGKDGSCCGGKSSAGKSVESSVAPSEVTAPSVPAVAASPVEAKKKVEASLKHIYFAVGSSALNANARKSLDYNARILSQDPDLSLSLHGVADSSGNAAANERLAAKRGEAAKQYLISKGIPASKISVGKAEVGNERAAIIRLD